MAVLSHLLASLWAVVKKIDLLNLYLGDRAYLRILLPGFLQYRTTLDNLRQTFELIALEGLGIYDNYGYMGVLPHILQGL